MAFFQEFTTTLKQKWLDYYQANREWLVLQMDISSIDTPDGGRRPSSAMILGTINALDPEAALLMFPFSKLNPDPEKLIEVLGLHFDPEHELARISGSLPDQPPVAQEPVKAAPGYHPPRELTLEPEPEEDLGLGDAEEELATDDLGLDLGDDATDDLATDDMDLGLGDDATDDLATDDMDLGLGDDATDDLATDDMDLGLGDDATDD
ncbi:DUF5331 domain-containing protein, partial [Limnospira platensis]